MKILPEQRKQLARTLLEGCSSILGYEKFLSKLDAAHQKAEDTVKSLMSAINTAREVEKAEIEQAKLERE